MIKKLANLNRWLDSRGLSKEAIAVRALVPEDIHDAADEAGIDWDDNEDFMLASEVLTGERHLDDMCQGQLGTIMDAIDLYKRKEDSSN
tara:strand:- start:7096 stop:7362 length:267 start_codon:yes stop_codon:yes gene_type:complete